MKKRILFFSLAVVVALTFSASAPSTAAILPPGGFTEPNISCSLSQGTLNVNHTNNSPRTLLGTLQCQITPASPTITYKTTIAGKLSQIQSTNPSFQLPYDSIQLGAVTYNGSVVVSDGTVLTSDLMFSFEIPYSSSSSGTLIIPIYVKTPTNKPVLPRGHRSSLLYQTTIDITAVVCERKSGKCYY